MNSAAIVAIILGMLVAITRAHLLLFPANALRWLGELIKTEARTRMLGVFSILIAVAMIWSSADQTTTIEGVLFIFGVFIIVIAVPALLVFPKAYMGLANSFMPEDQNASLFAWRLLGLIGLIIGVAIVMAGIDAL